MNLIQFIRNKRDEAFCQNDIDDELPCNCKHFDDIIDRIEDDYMEIYRILSLEGQEWTDGQLLDMIFELVSEDILDIMNKEYDNA